MNVLRLFRESFQKIATDKLSTFASILLLKFMSLMMMIVMKPMFNRTLASTDETMSGGSEHKK